MSIGPADQVFGGDAKNQPENPTLPYWPDNILYLIPESWKSYPKNPERANNLKKYGTSVKSKQNRRLGN